METLTECHICRKWTRCELHHMLHGSMRKLADEDKLYVMLCPDCHRKLHDYGLYDKVLQQEAEHMWLSRDPNRTIDDFIKRYGKNFL